MREQQTREQRGPTSQLIQRRETSQFEFGLPFPPWMAYSFGKEMKPRRRIFLWISFACLVVIIAVLLHLLPPTNWSEVTIGMKKDEVNQIIPRFDQPWGGIKADFKYEKRFPFMWRLAVGYNPSGVDMIEKELFVTWPETRKLWGTIEP